MKRKTKIENAHTNQVLVLHGFLPAMIVFVLDEGAWPGRWHREACKRGDPLLQAPQPHSSLSLPSYAL